MRQGAGSVSLPVPPAGSVPLKDITFGWLVAQDNATAEVAVSMLEVVITMVQEDQREMANHVLRCVYIGPNVAGYFPGAEPAIEIHGLRPNVLV